MTERTTGIRTLLSVPFGYEAFQTVVGARRSRRLLAERHLRVTPGARILDLGCGPGDVLEALPRVDYVGVDTNPRYIHAARRRYGDRGRFVCGDARTEIPVETGFELVFAIGILHHLDDDGVHRLLRLAVSKLRPNGRLVTFDGALRLGQPRLARWLLQRDRGAHVRRVEEYVRLADEHFNTVSTTVSDDYLRVPYTHVVLEGTQPVSTAAGQT